MTRRRFALCVTCYWALYKISMCFMIVILDQMLPRQEISGDAQIMDLILFHFSPLNYM